MLKWISAIAIAFPAMAVAQDYEYFITRQECGPSNTMFDEAMVYGEKPLFQGSNITVDSRGGLYYSEMFFTVNQDTGSWSLFSIFEDNIVCLVSFGGLFEPISR